MRKPAAGLRQRRRSCDARVKIVVLITSTDQMPSLKMKAQSSTGCLKEKNAHRGLGAGDSDDNRSSCDNQSCDVSDFYISDMIISSLPFSGDAFTDDICETNCFPDYKCAESNILFDVSESNTWSCGDLLKFSANVKIVNVIVVGVAVDAYAHRMDAVVEVVAAVVEIAEFVAVVAEIAAALAKEAALVLEIAVVVAKEVVAVVAKEVVAVLVEFAAVVGKEVVAVASEHNIVEVAAAADTVAITTAAAAAGDDAAVVAEGIAAAGSNNIATSDYMLEDSA
ncbi:hypothetical protein J5N97_001922 [Dioscorea zingiberensis]|uniref:Uncharacterized protein n=1 Tax=Dioscorea zingiberensis TaxID=325984 RepID=A0A9D5BSY9_9LILI|nr:hypothetical protein J5N97_001922 [Dioscorea zingiberensis]